MKKEGNNYTILWGSIFVLSIIALIIAASYDLEINQYLYSSYNGFAYFMEAFGWLVAFFPPMLVLLLLGTRSSTPHIYKVGCAFLLITGALILGFVSSHYVEKRFAYEFAFVWIPLLFVASTLIIYYYMMYYLKVSEDMQKKLMQFAKLATILTVSIFVISNVMKVVWMRTRFDDMVVLHDFSLFTPWYQPFGNGGNSFPSGHTVQAASILYLLFLCDIFPKWEKKKGFVFFFCWLYIITMAITRMLIGRHFLSDVTMSILLASILYLVCCYYKQRKDTLTY